MARGTAGARHAGRRRAAHVTDVARLVVGAEHDVPMLHKRAANTGAHSRHEAAGLTAAAAPARLAERMGMHVVEDAAGKPGSLRHLSRKRRTAPAGHELVGEGDVARAGVHHAG